MHLMLSHVKLTKALRTDACIALLVFFLFTPGFKKHVPLVGDGKVEERCTKTLLPPGSHCMFVCSPVCSRLARYMKDTVECMNLARFRKQSLCKN